MSHRWFVLTTTALMLFISLASGCRRHQVAHVLNDSQKDLVGSHEAGAETFNALIDQCCGALMSRQMEVEPAEVARASFVEQRRVCFIGVENASAEEIGDFKEQIHEQIETMLTQHPAFEPISRRYVDAGLNLSRLRPDELFIPANMREFTSIMEQSGQPVDYLMYAKLTSGTTQSNADYQRDYRLTLEIINVQTGQMDKEQALIRKGYHKNHISKWLKYNPFTR
jgi:Peptidoglycan-synthase activator LpoB